ncbi:helix-turn-helix transcriptional regulator [Kitasatospora kifunensis]|uniref:DNA-binding CsgD family transcriptional regulator n=1 Tax=Kitasatospora kifunensis TaxID=58351 RepID=A0A7W7R9T8_KITKI|nr:LuxR family transcriptional regulator [Kitasatospora kifunensis]MBB4927964.1 DNA-binding CsgD family transcriptional regulator [Kitasatospora kifunensis]
MDERPLIGREAQTDRILGVVGAGRRAPQALLVLGEAGTGKTALLDLAAEHARGIGTKVLTSQGYEGESEQSFASLHQLLLPLLPDLAGLPAHLREALQTAFGMVAAGKPVDSMLLRVAVLTLLADVSRRRPLLLIVDDIQLFDRDSREVLSFVLRRFAAEPVTVLLAARGLTPPAGIAAGVPALVLGPLTGPAAARLLEAQPHSLPGRARIDVLEQADGNPLAIIELCRAARGGSATGLPGGGLPQTLRIQEMFATRLRALPASTQRLVLYAAASSDHTDLATIMAAAKAGSDLAVWGPAEDAGLIAIADGQVGFRHPLVRAASYQGSSAHLRQRAHSDFAAVLEADPARRAWHLAAACLGPDESVAAALENTAGIVEQRGGLFAAARALERAAEFSPAEADRARRYANAIRAASNAGDPSWVGELYTKVAAVTEDRDMLCASACGAAMALSFYGRQREAFQVLMGAADPPPKDGTTMLAVAALVHTIGFQSGLAEIRRPVASLLDRVSLDDVGAFPTQLMPSEAVEVIWAGVFAGIDPVANAPALLSRTRRPSLLTPLPGPAEVARLQVVGSIAFFSDEPDLALDAFRQTFALLRSYGAMGTGANSLAPMAVTLIDTGRWAEADELLTEMWTLAVVHRLTHVEVAVDALRMLLSGLRGAPGGGGEAAGPSWTAVSLAENRATHVYLLRASGAALAASGDYEGAYRHLRQLFGDDGEPLHYFLSPRSIADLAALAHRTGRQQEVAPVIAAVRELAGARPTTRMTLLLHHATALVSDLGDAEQHFRLAVVNPAAEQWPLARAQARLHYAQWLRRRRRPSEARELLVTALETFTRLGAARLAEEARGELRASGVATAPAAPGPLSELTAHEQRIVRLAAKGLRNREIAEQLMLSPRTIGAHLYNVYPKLGVSRRQQLRDFFDDL